MKLYGALEAGGTKMVCSIGDEDCNVLESATFPTESPEITMPKMVQFFAGKGISALGIASFGPLDLNKCSPTYGYITTTPKPHWGNFPLLPEFREALQIPMEIDTDVNGAALAEYTMGAAKGLRSCLYVTIGTGVGGGLVIEGNLVHGLVHPEFGHMLLRPVEGDPTPDGFCPYHKGCLEGLCSGPAIEKRWNMSAKLLPHDHPAWDIECSYLAQMCLNSILTFSPEKIILGGGVMQQKWLFPIIRSKTLAILNNYVSSPTITSQISSFIVEPALNTQSGVKGALLLAKMAR